MFSLGFKLRDLFSFNLIEIRFFNFLNFYFNDIWNLKKMKKKIKMSHMPRRRSGRRRPFGDDHFQQLLSNWGGKPKFAPAREENQNLSPNQGLFALLTLF